MKKLLPILTLFLSFTSFLSSQTTDWGIKGEGIEKNGTYYAIYDDTARTVGLNKIVTYKYNVPGTKLTYQAKKQWAGLGSLHISDGYNTWEFSCATNHNSDGKTVDSRSRVIQFTNPSPNSLNKYVQQVHLTMASYLDEPNTKSLSFSEKEIGAVPDALSFTFDWCNTGNIAITYTGDTVFSVIENNLSTDGKYGTAIVTVIYKHTKAGTQEGIITISKNGTAIYTVKLTGSTYKHHTILTWEDNISPMQVGTTITNAAKASNNGLVTYRSSNTDIIRVEDNRLIAVAQGTVTITASYAGNDKWSEVTESKEIDVTEQQTQYIHWTQSFLRLNTDMADILLQAQSYATETETPTGLSVTYTVSDESVATILPQTDAEGNTLYYLHIVAAGTTTITASCAGNDSFAPAEDITTTIVVRIPSEGCNPLVYEQNTPVDLSTSITDFTGTYGQEIELKGEPGYLSFDAKKSKNARKDLSVRKFLDGEWIEIADYTLTENYHRFDSISLERNVTRIQFYKKSGATLTHTYTNVAVTLAKYLESDVEALDFTDVIVGAPVGQSLTIKYSNIPDVLFADIVGDDEGFFYINQHQEKESIGYECGDKGTTTLDIYFLPTEERTYSATLRIADKNDKMVLDIPLSGKATATQLFVKQWTMFYTDDYTYDVAKQSHERLIYVLDGDNYANLTIRSGNAITFAKEENVLLPIEADRWRTVVPPFDVDVTYIIELVPDNVLSSHTRSEAIAMQQEANRELYAWLAQQTDAANQGTTETRTFVDLIEEYIAALCKEKGYASDAIGIYTLEQYNGNNSWTSNYFAYYAGNEQWNLIDDTSLDVKKEWQVETATEHLMRKGQVYAIKFPYCIDCNPATSDEYDYWSGKCLLLHGNGGQQIEGAAVHQSIQDKASTLSPNQVLFTGNHTLSAMPIEAGKAYLHQTDPTKEYYDYYVRQESAVQLPPLTSVLFANPADVAGRTLRAVSRRGQAYYDKAPDVTTGLPAIANGADVLAVVRQGGVLLQAKEETAVALYSASGMLVWKGIVGNTQQFVPLTHTGLYLLQTLAHTQKIVCR